MTTGEVLASPHTGVIVLVAFLGSLFACRSFAARFWFTLIAPIAYASIWSLCMITFGSIAGFISHGANTTGLNRVAELLSILFCLGLFIVQVSAMASDPRSGRGGHAIARSRVNSLQPQALGLAPSPLKQSMGG